MRKLILFLFTALFVTAVEPCVYAQNTEDIAHILVYSVPNENTVFDERVSSVKLSLTLDTIIWDANSVFTYAFTKQYAQRDDLHHISVGSEDGTKFFVSIDSLLIKDYCYQKTFFYGDTIDVYTPIIDGDISELVIVKFEKYLLEFHNYLVQEGDMSGNQAETARESVDMLLEAMVEMLDVRSKSQCYLLSEQAQRTQQTQD